VIRNAAVGYREGHRVTSDGLPHVFAINTLSAYIDRAGRAAETPRLSQFRHASQRQRQSRRHLLEKASLEQLPGLCREQAP
jgi:hypothetical protein